MKPVYCTNKKIDSCHECILRRTNKDCGGVTLDIKEHKDKLTFEERLDRMRTLTTEPPVKYDKRDKDGRVIVTSLRASSIPKRQDGTVGWSDTHKTDLIRLTDIFLNKQELYSDIDLQELVKRYQGGEEHLFDAIRKKIELTANFVMNSYFSCGKCQFYENGFHTATWVECPACHTQGRPEKHEADSRGMFTTLEGKSAKSSKRGQILVLKSGDDEYNENETTQVDLTFDPFKFNEDDKNLGIDKSLTETLKTYEPGKGTFKTWFKHIYSKDALDLYDEYRGGWQYKRKKANQERYENKLRESGRAWDYSILYTNYPAGYLNRLSDDHKRLLLVKERAGSEALFKKYEAAALGIETDKRRSLQGELEGQYFKWLELKQEPEEVTSYQLDNYNEFIKEYYYYLHVGLLLDPPVMPVWPLYNNSCSCLPNPVEVSNPTCDQALNKNLAMSYSDLKTTNKVRCIKCRQEFTRPYYKRFGRSRPINEFKSYDYKKTWTLTTVTGASFSMLANMSHSDDALKNYSDKNKLLTRVISGKVQVPLIIHKCDECKNKELIGVFPNKYMRGEIIMKGAYK